MSVLDRPEGWAALDPQSMLELVESFPRQVEAAADMAANITLPALPLITKVLVTGLGGSAIGGDVVRSVIGDCLRLPFLVNRDYHLPKFVDSSTLVIASSYSGNTEETLSAYQEAIRAGAKTVCITTGGQLASMAEAGRVPVIYIPGGLPPRTALGYSSIVLLGILRALGLVPGMAEAVEESTKVLWSLSARYAGGVPDESNRAKALAHSLHGKIVGLYASTGLLEAAAVRWRGQIEENAKNLAFHHLLPEMNHNELVGWEKPRERLRELGVVFLRDRGDHPQVQRRFELTREMLASRAKVVHEVWSEGQSPLARVLSTIYLGDFVSVYLAYLNAVDPTPVRGIDMFKQRLR